MIDRNITPLRIRPSGEARLFDVFQRAQEAGLHLVSNGFDVYVTPIILPGERKVGVRVVPPAQREAA